jgi:SulP family sulfate permease
MWLCLASGLLITACGLARLGFLAQLLSRPVVSGFVSGSAVLIMLSQIRFITGVETTVASGAQGQSGVFVALLDMHPLTSALGLGTIFVLALARRYLTPWPTVQRVFPLVVLMLATMAVVLADLDTAAGVAVVGPVPLASMQTLSTLPDLPTLQALAGPTLLLAFIGMVQCITMAQALAAKRRERVDANRELVGLGAANVAAAFTGGMPVGGGLSRSAINVAAGAQTPLASVVSGLSMVGVLLLGTAWLTRMPLAVLAASIMVAAWGMIDLRSLRQAWAYDRADALAWLGTALGVLTLGLERGIALGIGLSLATLLWRTSAPHIALIGRLPGTQTFRNVERHHTETLPRTLMLRIDESLFFGNLQAVEARLATELRKFPQTRDVVWVMTAVNRIDTSAVEVFTGMNLDLKERGIRMHLAEVKGPVQDRLMHTSLWTELTGTVYRSVQDAFEELQARHATPEDAALSI